MEYATCIDISSPYKFRTGLTLGKQYEILTRVMDREEMVEVLDDKGTRRCFYARRFEFKDLGPYYKIIHKINAIKTRRESLGYRW